MTINIFSKKNYIKTIIYFYIEYLGIFIKFFSILILECPNYGICAFIFMSL